jgi:dihydrofolate synthase/folylpolyglutamate synthase
MDYFRAKRYLDLLPDWEVGRPAHGPVEDYLPRMRALLGRLQNPQERFRSLIVGGTNGKGTVASLLAALLQADGHQVGLYTSPHLHTQRERIRVGSEVLHKDRWAEAVAHLDDCTRDFAAEGLGPFSKFEALTGLAAWFFAQQRVEFGIFEVGLGGRYDAANAWDSELAILTSVGLDHMEFLGDTIAEIAADKLDIIRPGGTLVTSAVQDSEVVALARRTCAERQVELHMVEGDWTLSALAGRPATYGQNAGLALEAAERLCGKFATERVAEVVENHRWPGRFETAQNEPLVLLDGAHNPASAAALADDLRQQGRDWVVVVGAATGHDAEGIVRALVPMASRFVLTSSAHPRAVDPAVLAALVPDGLAAEVLPVCARAFARAVELAGAQGRVCVLGSLHLVARAREFFDLPHERDGITEDMALENLQCLAAASRSLGLGCEWISVDGTRLKVTGGRRPFRFWRNKHPFNDYVEAQLAEDKAYQYEDFVAAELPTPFTLKIFNPLADPRFDRYKTHASVAQIVEEVQARFDFPVVVKKARSSLAQGVFLEPDVASLEKRLAAIFAHSAFLDNIALVQQFVAGAEYRVVASCDELLLAYGKEGETAAGNGDLNPLHQTEGRAVRLEDGPLLRQLRELTRRVAQVYTLGFYAIDLIHGADGFTILELNPNPMCFFYNRDNGRRDFIGLYEKLLKRFVLAVD